MTPTIEAEAELNSTFALRGTVWEFRLRLAAWRYLHEKEKPPAGHDRNWLFMWRAYLDCIEAGQSRPKWIDDAVEAFARAQVKRTKGADVRQFKAFNRYVDAVIDVRKLVRDCGVSVGDAMRTVSKDYGISVNTLKKHDLWLKDAVTEQPA